MGLLVGLYAYKVLLSKPRRAADLEQKKKAVYETKPASQSEIPKSLFHHNNLLSINSSRESKNQHSGHIWKSKISVQLIPGGTELLVQAQRNLISHAFWNF